MGHEHQLDADADAEAETKQQQTASATEKAWRITTQIALCCVFMCMSTSLIILNKILIVDLNFHFPMAVTGMGMAVSSVGSYVCCRVLKTAPAEVEVTWKDVVTKITPVGFWMAVTMHSGNEAYRHLSLSFIQMMKAVTPIITMIALFIAKLENPTPSIIYSVVVICFGTAVSVYGELNLTALGMVFMMISEVAEACRLVLTQYLLTAMHMHPMESLMYLAPACLALLTLGSITREWPLIIKEGALGVVMQHYTKFAAAAVMGFGVNLMGYVVIKRMGSVTLKILAIIRNVLIVGLGVLYMGDIVTGLQLAGYAISLGGFMWYNYLLLTR